ncbi:MAG: hypothetical protein ABIS43_15130 [Opitutus sp.]
MKATRATLAELWNEPLTVEVRVPASWQRYVVTQGDRTERGPIVTAGAGRIARVQVQPNRGPARVMLE